jgi:nitrate/nitrite transport system substrate-binding protein
MSEPRKGRITRRSMLKRGTAAAGLAMSGALPRWAQAITNADDAPETPEVTFGMIALTDCSPIVIAHEKGFFKKYGIQSRITKPANWAAIRDALINGDTQATHMLLGMPIASTMGLGGGNSVPMVIPWLLNRNGQAITLKSDFRGKVGADPKALKPYVDEAKEAGTKLTFAMTFPPGTHAMWMRYYLAAGGIHPDKDVDLITIPPPQMVANMKVGKMDGFCVGEPWNARAIAEEIGFTAVTTQELWKDHPEKVCAFTAEFAEQNPKTVKACLKALNDASVWLDDLANRPEQCQIVGRDAYIKCPPEAILDRLQGKLDYGDGRTAQDENYMIFSQRNCNYPQPAYGKWWLSQFRRWGLVEGAPDYEGIVKQVFRTDLYEEAMKEAGHAHGGTDNSPWTMIDGVNFDPSSDPEAYAASFPIKNIKG